MTDLLGLLAGMNGAVTQLGSLRLAITELDDMDWVVDRRTRTVHLRPGMSLQDNLQAVADALAVLAPPVAEPAPIAVGGALQADASRPATRRLAVVRPV